jgi:uncharacterized protein (DUF1499 family)
MRLSIFLLSYLATSARGAQVTDESSRERRLNRLAELLLALDSPSSTRPAAGRTTLSRRAALGSGVLSAFAISPAYAGTTACSSQGFSNNCISTKGGGKEKIGPWTYPAGASRDQAIADLTAVVNAYPQAGQNEVDGGGWAVVDDQLKSSGYVRYEFKSSGKNWQSKFLNGGKPFTDDVEFEFGDSTVDVKSSSRLGDSDFGVNGKRLNYITAELRKKGWEAKGGLKESA